jgi:hypothetical protein
MYILRTDEPFRGHVQSHLLDDGTVAYSGKTFEEYNAEKGGVMKIISEEELDELLAKFHKETYTDVPWKRITEERWWDLLECLPPRRWADISNKVNAFYISEATTSHLHTWCIKDSRGAKTEADIKYYRATRSRFATNEELFNDFESNKDETEPNQ